MERQREDMLASLPAAGGCDNIPSRLLSPTQKGMSLSADQLVSQILRLRGTNRVEGSLDSAKGHAGHMPLKLAAFPTPRPWKHCHMMLAVPPPELPAMQVGPQGQIHILNLPRVRTPESLTSWLAPQSNPIAVFQCDQCMCCAGCYMCACADVD